MNIILIICNTMFHYKKVCIIMVTIVTRKVKSNKLLLTVKIINMMSNFRLHFHLGRKKYNHCPTNSFGYQLSFQNHEKNLCFHPCFPRKCKDNKEESALSLVRDLTF